MYDAPTAPLPSIPALPPLVEEKRRALEAEVLQEERVHQSKGAFELGVRPDPGNARAVTEPRVEHNLPTQRFHAPCRRRLAL